MPFDPPRFVGLVDTKRAINTCASANDNGSPTQTIEHALRSGVNYTYTQTHGFDGLNRLVSASDNGVWTHNYGYDQFGNMWLSSYSGPAQSGLMPTAQSSINAATNQLNVSVLTYDPAATGNVTVAGTSNLGYDAENRIVSDYDSVTTNMTNYSTVWDSALRNLWWAA